MIFDMRKLTLAIFAVCMLCGIQTSKAETPFKNVWVELDAAPSGGGQVWLEAEDPDPVIPSTKGATTQMACTLGENGSDDSIEDEMWKGKYEMKFFAEPAEGYHLVGFVRELKADGNYSDADFVGKESGCTVNVNPGTPEDARKTDQVDETAARATAKTSGRWPDGPDFVFYAIFSDKFAHAAVEYAPYQEPEQAGTLGTLTISKALNQVGDAVTLTATPVPGAHFVSWSDQDGNVLSTEAVFNTTIQESVTKYVGKFALDAVTIPAEGYLAYSVRKAFRVGDAGLKAKVITDVTATKATMAEVTMVNSNCGVVLMGTPSQSYELNSDVSALDMFLYCQDPVSGPLISNNKFSNTASGTVVSDGTYYMYKEGALGKGLYLLEDGEEVPMLSAYVSFTPGEDEASPLFIPVEDSTGIDALPISSETVDGRLYNLAGQRVTNAYKGIIVKNGKKYINK